CEAHMLVPIGYFRETIVADVGVLLKKHAEESVLPAFGVTLRFLSALHSFIKYGHQLRPPAQGIHCAALDEGLHHPFVQQSEVHVLAELKDGSVAAQLLASFDNGVNRVVSDVLNRGQAETNGLSMRGKVGVADIDIRRLDSNAHFTAFVDV